LGADVPIPERAEALKGVSLLDTVVSFSDRMTLYIGGKTIVLMRGA
jgi:hypothetical protein